ncbi:MAG: hypothetical protein DBY39_03900 [Clostridiales bacterium]|nr:MAG: hypothetical protein DBY39_03900 [Clostridiales bacterium]
MGMRRGCGREEQLGAADRTFMHLVGRDIGNAGLHSEKLAKFTVFRQKSAIVQGNKALACASAAS